MGILQGVRVIEVGSSVALSYCGRMFADFGAEVIKTEPEEGDALRSMFPIIDIGEGRQESAWFAWANTNKKSITADWHKAADAQRIAALIASADIFLDARTPEETQTGALAHAALTTAHPGLILTNITAFGGGGPYENYQASEAVIRALGGLVEGMGPVDGPPMLVDDSQNALKCGLAAFIPTAAALLDRASGGREIEVSCQEAVAHAVELDMSYAARGVPRKRAGVNLFGRHYPASIYKTADGWLGVSTVTHAQWCGMCQAFGLGDIAEDPRFCSHDARLQHVAELDAKLEPVIATKTSDEWFTLCNQLKLPVVIVPRMDQLLTQKVHRQRSAFVPVRIGSAEFEGPVSPARLGGEVEPLHGGTAPLSGVDDAEYVIPPDPRPAGRRADPKRMPLEGVRIIDLTMGWAGPFCTRHLADLGAEVIKVEGCSYPDWWRGTNYSREFYEERLYEKNNAYNMMNRNKRVITLDLTSEEGRALLLDLVAEADGFVENYSSEVLPKLGLSHQMLLDRNPRLVVLPMPAFGLHNDWSATRAYGGTLEQATGLPTLTGQDNWPPTMTAYAYGDPVGGYNSATAMLLGLLARRATGKGRIISFSQIEAMLAISATGIVEQSTTGRLSARIGNRHRRFAPQGAYPGKGDNNWLVLTIRSDEEWRALAPLIDLATPDLATVAARHAAHDRIDVAIAAWSSGHTADSAMQALQGLGIAAGVARATQDLLTDPNMVARDTWARIPREYVGECVLQRTAYRLNGAACPIRNPAPTLGQHNDDILRGILGLTDTRIEALEARGIIGTKAYPKGTKKPAA